MTDLYINIEACFKYTWFLGFQPVYCQHHRDRYLHELEKQWVWFPEPPIERCEIKRFVQASQDWPRPLVAKQSRHLQEEQRWSWDQQPPIALLLPGNKFLKNFHGWSDEELYNSIPYCRNLYKTQLTLLCAWCRLEISHLQGLSAWHVVWNLNGGHLARIQREENPQDYLEGNLGPP